MAVATVGTDYPILVVDDSRVSLLLITKILTQGGFAVTSAGDGEEALTLIKQTYFPVVITDWQMPNMDGAALCEAVRKLDSSDKIYIIVLSATESQDDILTVLKAGADDFIIKPFKQDELINKVKKGLCRALK
ncbi:MAG: response regulator [Deltaproteobacteria bacterium]|nr:response regulator [Deltaproteobacteria bacterium]